MTLTCTNLLGFNLMIRIFCSSWNSLLSLCTAEVQSKCSKWWFYIQSLCQEFVTNGEGEEHYLIV